MSTRPRPVALQVSADVIPAELKAVKAWVTWRYELNEKQDWTKVPYQQDGRVKASSTNPETWTSFEKVLKCYQRGGVDGIGFALTKGHGIAGVDLDHCFDESKKIMPWALKIIFELDSYTEFSPSGNGVRIFLKASAPVGGNKKGNIEMYDSARYLTVTGCHRAGTPQTIEMRQEKLGALHGRVFAEQPKPEAFKPRPAVRLELSDEELLRRVLKREKAKALYGGDSSAYPSASEATLALCDILAYYTQDGVQIDRLMRASGLYREKWDAKRGQETWGQRTISKAMEGR